MADYLAENGRRIEIIGQLSVNDSVQFLGLSDQAWVTRMRYICNLQALVGATWWGSGKYSNQVWGGSMFDAYIITNVVWGASVDPIRLTCRRVLLNHAPPDAASATTSFVTDVKSVGGATTVGVILWSILGFVIGRMTGMVRLLGNFCSKFPLIV